MKEIFDKLMSLVDIAIFIGIVAFWYVMLYIPLDPEINSAAYDVQQMILSIIDKFRRLATS